eukprot:6276628-Prymnesium_polylepis.1
MVLGLRMPLTYRQRKRDWGVVNSSDRLERVRADRLRRQSATGIAEDRAVVRARAAASYRRSSLPALSSSAGPSSGSRAIRVQHSWIEEVVSRTDDQLQI